MNKLKTAAVRRVRHPEVRRPLTKYSPPPMVPRALAGKWVAWSRDRRVLTSGDSLAEVVAHVERNGIKGASYELVPKLNRAFRR